MFGATEALLLQCRDKPGNEVRLLFGQDGAQVEQQAVVFDTGNHRQAFCHAAQTLFQLRGGATDAADSYETCGQALIWR